MVCPLDGICVLIVARNGGVGGVSAMTAEVKTAVRARRVPRALVRGTYQPLGTAPSPSVILDRPVELSQQMIGKHNHFKRNVRVIF